MKRIFLLGVLGTLLAFAAQGGDIYRWTDETGRVHLSDEVPPQYKAKATRIDSRRFELTPQQRRDAEARLARARRQLAASEPSAGSPGAGLIRPGSAASGAEGADCETLQREYRESLDCFAPFVNANGSLKPNAFAACRQIVDPSPKCGPTKAY